ncbi:sirohydrochlorin chelatase [Catenuloplanes indicus]|uniref:Sirohydrochlorin ferrochelatase n=1 Tax=Catenuloplanes indicus TaxID=137267 RepID=A0AAE3W4Q6_9ACTN|nr:CbiX/SirB N-terminal domain-containing protein [Catenuloplanes indicus]MDQ0368684.1 sirohydrochlorin ferrochelatase [Catenuloplanes indicus]
MRTSPLTGGAALVLVAHGSRDPRAANATRALVRAVAALRPGADVRASYLDHAGPRPGEVLTALEAAGCERAVLVPLLLTAAYHGRVDIPEVLRTARAEGLRMPVAISEVIGPFDGVVPDLLLAGLVRRLSEVTDVRPVPSAAAETGVPAAGERGPAEAGIGVPDPGFDAVVLAAAGTNDATARGTVAQAAVALGDQLGVPCTVAYASASAPTGAEAVTALRAAGARRIAIAGYFLAPGLLYDTVVESARSAGGVVAVAPPLTDARDIARLVLSRADAVIVSSTALAA